MKKLTAIFLFLFLVLSCKTKKENSLLPEEVLTEDFLNSKSLEELQIIRNEFFARKGYVFKNKKIKQYFEKKDWYTPKPDINVELTENEKKKVALIQKIEAEKKEKSTSTKNNITPLKKLTQQELESKTNEELTLLRNEVFARQGYVFENKKIREYFEDKKWYKPNSKAKITLTKEEQEYINLIKELEKNKAD